MVVDLFLCLVYTLTFMKSMYEREKCSLHGAWHCPEFQASNGANGVIGDIATAHHPTQEEEAVWGTVPVCRDMVEGAHPVSVQVLRGQTHKAGGVSVALATGSFIIGNLGTSEQSSFTGLPITTKPISCLANKYFSVFNSMLFFFSLKELYTNISRKCIHCLAQRDP